MCRDALTERGTARAYGERVVDGGAVRGLTVAAMAVLGAAALVLVVALWPAGGSGDGRVRGFGRISATVTAPGGASQRLCLLHADTGQQAQRGLMGVTDRSLGGCDGMAFTIGEDTREPFWMRNTPLPLSVAYFDADGRLVSTADMAPCGDHPFCRRYPPARPYRYAVETLRGELPRLGIVRGARLTLGPRGCEPAASPG